MRTAGCHGSVPPPRARSALSHRVKPTGLSLRQNFLSAKGKPQDNFSADLKALGLTRLPDFLSRGTTLNETSLCGLTLWLVHTWLFSHRRAAPFTTTGQLTLDRPQKTAPSEWSSLRMPAAAEATNGQPSTSRLSQSRQDKGHTLSRLHLTRAPCPHYPAPT